MSGTLNLALDLALPLEVVGRKVAILGMTGSGKTSTGVVLVEEAHEHGVPFVVLDPTGAWFGLRSSADGSGPGVPLVLFGGDHADVPLEAAAGRYVARLVAERTLPGALLDLSLLTRSDQLRFVFEFLDELYHLNREPILVVVDEAHRFAPQNAGASDRGGYGARAHRALVDAVTMGRRKGLGVALICPRPAKLAKDALELCDVMIAHQLRGTNDRKAVAAWVDDTDAGEAAGWLDQLPRFATGQALVSAPALGVDGVFQIREKRTFDSSATPPPGQAVVVPAGRPDVNLDDVRQAMADTIERQQTEDPERLRERIRELEANAAASIDADLQRRAAELEKERDQLRVLVGELEHRAGQAVDRQGAAERALRAVTEALADHAQIIHAADAVPIADVAARATSPRRYCPPACPRATRARPPRRPPSAARR